MRATIFTGRLESFDFYICFGKAVADGSINSENFLVPERNRAFGWRDFNSRKPQCHKKFSSNVNPRRARIKLAQKLEKL